MYVLIAFVKRVPLYKQVILNSSEELLINILNERR